MTEAAKEIFILGGPNGAGKTTAARRFLPHFLLGKRFLNADEIARELSASNVEAAALPAARLLLSRFRQYIREGRSFALETTCSGRSYVPWLRNCAEDGWRIIFFYLWLPSPEQSIARVAHRVRTGGHFVSREDIERRFRPGLWNMRHLYLPLADSAAIYDNSGSQQVLIADKEAGMPLRVVDSQRWQRIEELTT